MDPNQIHVSSLLQGYDFDLIKRAEPVKAQEASLMDPHQSVDTAANSHQHAEDKDSSDLCRFSKEGPSANTIAQRDSCKPLTDENATFKWEVNLLEKDIKAKLAEEKQGITLMSCAF